MRTTREEIVSNIQQTENERQTRYLEKLWRTEEACLRHEQELDAERTQKAIELAESRKLAMERIQANRAQVAHKRHRMIRKVEEKNSRARDITTGSQITDEVRAEQMRARQNFTLQKQALAEEAKKIRLPLFQAPIQDTRASRLRSVHNRLVKRKDKFEEDGLEGDAGLDRTGSTKRGDAANDEVDSQLSLDAPPKSGRKARTPRAAAAVAGAEATTPRGHGATTPRGKAAAKAAVTPRGATTPRAKAKAEKERREKNHKMRLMRCAICEIESYNKDLIDLERSVVQTILSELGALEPFSAHSGPPDAKGNGGERPARVCESCLDFAGNYRKAATEPQSSPQQGSSGAQASP